MLPSCLGHRLFSWIAILITCLPSLLLGQQTAKKVAGKIVHSENGKGVPYANIYVRGTPIGTASNKTGEFELRVISEIDFDNYLIFSSIGYRSDSLPLKKAMAENHLEIFLRPETVQLREVVVNIHRERLEAATAKNIVHKAFKNVKNNYPTDDYLLKAFYRHYCKENDVYGRLIEAAVDVYDPKGYKRYFELATEKVEMQVGQLRRSYDFTSKANHQHTPISLNYILSQDVLAYTYKNPLADNLSDFEFELIDTTSFENQPVYVIGFAQTDNFYSLFGKSFQGKMYINAPDYAILRIAIKAGFKHSDKLDTAATWIEKMIHYRRYLNKYYVHQIISDGYASSNEYDSLGNKISNWDHEAHVEIMVNNIILGGFKKFKGAEPSRQELLEIEYTPDFWEGYTILKATPLEKKIENDLATRAPLDQQFETFNIVSSRGRSILENPDFVNTIDAYEGNVVYVVIWSSWGFPEYFEVKPNKYFKKRMKKNKLKYLFISVDENEDMWLKNRKYYRLDIDMAKHKRIHLDFTVSIAKKYYNNLFPVFLLIDKNGNIVDKNPPRPYDPALKTDIRQLLRK